MDLRYDKKNYFTFMCSLDDDDTNGTVARAKVHGTYGNSEFEFHFAFILLVGSSVEASFQWNPSSTIK